MSFKINLSKKDRAASRFLAQVHSALSNAFVEAKRDKKVTQRSVCEALDVDKAVVSRILTGGGNPTARTIAELASALGYQPELILHKIEVANYANQAPWHEVEKRENSVDIIMVDRNSSRIDQNVVRIQKHVSIAGASL